MVQLNCLPRFADALHKLTAVLLLEGIILMATGCGAFRNSIVSGPATPKALQSGKLEDENVSTEIKNFYYNRCLKDASAFPEAPLPTPSPNCGSPKEQRNTVIYDLKRIIDSNYESYAHHFQQTADTVSLAGEVSAASLTAVGTLVGTTDLKNILTTASTLTQSTNVSIQKNYFKQQTETTILAQMDADRAKQWSEIVQRMGKDDVPVYSLSAALDDLQQYKRAGTATVALTSIVQQAGVQKDTAASQVKTTFGLH